MYLDNLKYLDLWWSLGIKSDFIPPLPPKLAALKHIENI